MTNENTFEETENIYEHLELTRLSEEYQKILVNFDCLNPNEDFPGVKSKKKKKFRQYSKGINEFLLNEALQEQNEGLNTTHLLLYKDKVIGFVSLCTDSIRLEMDEKKESGVPYANIPSLKIARLGIDKSFQKKGLGSFMIKYVVSIASKIRELSGVKFITVDCYVHRVSYYEKIGFKINKIQSLNRQPDNPLSLRLHIDNYLESLDLI